MRSLSFLILSLVSGLGLLAQSPHGADFKIDCASCHNPASWEIAFDSLHFNHDTTRFALTGQHAVADCRSCHETLVFADAEPSCISCHEDMHRTTVGTDCARCHNAENWLVTNITEIHQDNGFPLLGVHNTLDCASCHTSESQLMFERIGNDCINCHMEDFQNTTNPNHPAAGFSEDCSQCHDVNSTGWNTVAGNIPHDFFPLTKGHNINDCAACHANNVFSGLSSDCVSCHQQDFEDTQEPDHQQLGFATDCIQCHTTDPGWMPAEFRDHDGQYFPIYSGEHQGEWNSCADCHNNPADYSQFTCTNCHTNPQTDNEHDDVNGYVYENSACLACHPTGSEDDNFNHDNTAFPLTGSHVGINCLDCHADGFAGTPTDCAACHTTDFNNSTNPDHNALSLPMDCATCHTTDPDWMPASFPIHDDFYTLNGAHAVIKNDCASCHNGDYNNTPNTCIGCHQADYDNTTNPDHNALNFSTDCTTCHTEDAWIPSTFDHDMQYFPIYSGKHQGEWDDCRDCHTNPNDYSEFTCITCHMNPETDDEHIGVGGYVYQSDACLACHPTGDAGNPFDHNNTNFPLTGAHLNTDCLACHDAGFENTPTDCAACHQMDFENTQNPDHNSIGLSTDCASCHTTDPGWEPATFANHNDFYALNGAHALIANDCASCHNGDYNNTPNTCIGCHQSDFNNTTNPDHQASNFSTDCTTCHTEDAWIPSTFDHDGQYFPIYSGEHQGEWDQCVDCHTDPGDYTLFTCINCHINPETDDQHLGVGGYVYQSTACLACHPTGEADVIFDHNSTSFALTGAHLSTECLDCHQSGFAGTPTDCAECHRTDFNMSVNPNHNDLGLSMDCASCHSTEPDWQPATFANHNDFYALNGAHAAIANDCASCHNGDYNNTPNTCIGCHQADYDNTINPDHQTLMFSSDCTTCHTEDAWIPSTFDHDGQYFPIYSGEHQGEWMECVDCHTNLSNYAEVTCTNCHVNPETDDQHMGVNGYTYVSTACLACHPTGSADVIFDHNNTNFPLTGSHLTVDCQQCHAAGYTGTPTDCAACHSVDFNNTQNPNHNNLGLSMDCAMCHTTDPDWEPATFANHDDFYALNGAHAAIANDCASCHNGDYNNTPNTCVGCHQADYDNAINPNHQAAGFGTDCTTCHTENAWVPSTFDHDGQYFPVYSGEHEGEWSACVDCHTNPNNFAEFTCTTCHMNPETDDEHMGVQGYVYESTACLACHPTGDADVIFNHDMTSFPLTGEHLNTDCLECHMSGFAGTPTDCASCHQMDYDNSINPSHNSLGLSTDCATCHTTDPDWQPAQFPDHNTYYALNGAHAAIANDCVACHNGDYNNTPNTCVGCHQVDYDNTSNPNHAQAMFPTDCATCHSEDAWVPSTLDHDGMYFPIYSGEHEGEWSDCVDCHTNPNNFAEFSCTNCHINPETDDEHDGVGGYVYEDNACLACHPTGETGTGINHDLTNFPLTGAHVDVDCNLCHINGYQGTPTDCFACHQMDYDQTTNPSHNSLGLATDCASCHTTDPGWSPATFANHDDYWVIDGAHLSVANDCAACHNGDYNNTPTNCVGCHQADFDNSTNPSHPTLGIPTDCATCHTTDPGWEPAGFPIHDSYWVIDGAHLDVADNCAVCHNGDYNNTPNTCVGCHQADYDGTTNPNHIDLGLSTDCISCHTTAPDWMPASFPNHNSFYPLNGAHAIIANDCALCHNGDYNNTPNTCNGCHNNDYNSATNPDHATNQLPTDCQQCHTESAWVPSTFDHNAIYPFTGAHVDIQNDCNLCHNGNYVNTPNTCAGCHTPDYNTSTNPSHVSLGLPTDCESCHTTDPDWMPAAFPNHNAYYPLNGAHATIANNCVLCHNGDYNNTPTDCYGCHATDYSQTTNPNHTLNQFPTNCTDCHTENAWIPSTFDHNTIYPFTGAHIAIANDCNACHNGNYNNTPNTCDACHLTDYNTSINPNHTSLGLPTDCEMCHTTNPDWNPATFPIHDQYYQLVGAHANIASDCFACHMGDYNNTPNNCFGCHAVDYNTATNPDHATSQFPTDCELCHGQNAWTPANFDHDNMYFPIYSGKHQGEWNDCIDCHTVPGVFNIYSCIDCHEHNNQQEVDDDHDGVSGYVYQSTACYACHPDGTD